MLLIGRDLSPFVRRSAALALLLGLEFERKIVNTEDDADFIRRYNPLGRVPVLVLGEDDVIVDSHAIVDHLLSVGDPEARVLPATGPARRAALRHSSIAIGVMEKAVAAAYERIRRPEAYYYAPWAERLQAQICAGLEALDEALGDREWFGGQAPGLADIDAVVAFGHVGIVAREARDAWGLTRLAGLAERSEGVPALRETRWRG